MSICHTLTSVVAAATLGALALAPLPASAACYENIDARAAYDRMGDGPVLVLDVRTPGEYHGRDGHIAGAVLVPLSDLEAALAALDPYRDAAVIVVCHSGNRSSRASGILCDHGFHDIYNLAGGMIGWDRAGLPVARD